MKTDLRTPDYRQHLEVETPEHVVLDYEIAGVGSRALAAIIDSLILALWTVSLMVVFGLTFEHDTWAGALFLLLYFASLWGYFTFFEGFRQGQTPGKRRVGLRVVLDTGHPVTFGAAAVRNILRAADFLPPPDLTGALFVAIHPRAKRLGDLVAGTVVVRDRPTESPVDIVSGPSDQSIEDAGIPELSEEEFRLLREYIDRSNELAPDVARRFGARLADQFRDRFPGRSQSPSALLAELYRDETARRRGRFGAGGGERRIPGSRHQGGIVERLVVRKKDRWDAFQRIADRAATQGLDSFDAAELPDFAARYREVAADLARARTYGADSATRTRLERLVAAGHNSLYRDERKTIQRIVTVLARECPAAVIQARRYVLIAFLAFTLPAVAGFLLLRERPTLAAELLPDVMLERASAGAERVQQGKGYVEVGVKIRPLMASGIITNNVQVAFYCFAGGIFVGVGSLVLLAFNGLSIGATSAHFANVGLLGYLWTFIIGHGVLELFAIWVAGAAGFLLGKAIVAPGQLTRSDALVLNGRLAIRMIGTVIVLLCVAGSIEGFVSAGQGGIGFRLAVSASSAVFLVLYLVNGALWLRINLPAGSSAS